MCTDLIPVFTEVVYGLTSVLAGPAATELYAFLTYEPLLNLRLGIWWLLKQFVIAFCNWAFFYEFDKPDTRRTFLSVRKAVLRGWNGTLANIKHHIETTAAKMNHSNGPGPSGSEWASYSGSTGRYAQRKILPSIGHCASVFLLLSLIVRREWSNVAL